MAKSYIDGRGWKYKVMGDLAGTFKARYQKPNKTGDIGWKGVAALPRRYSLNAAQEDLDLYAAKKGMQVITEGGKQ